MTSGAALSSRHGLLYVMAMITSGTLNTVFTKMQYGVHSTGTELCVDPQDPTATTTLCAFDKPWFSSLLARIGMSLSLVAFAVSKKTNNSRFNDTAPLVLKPTTATTSATRLPGKTTAVIALLSLLDLSQTLIANVGLLWVPASVYQMACGSVVVFSALVSSLFLHRRLHAYHYAGIMMVCVAVVLVGWGGTTPDDTAMPSSSHALLGLSLIIMAQLITAVQFITEEYVMTTLHVDPLLLVGIEGLWGLLFFVVLIPVLTLMPAGPTVAGKIWHEDFYDSLVKISHSPALVALSLLNIAAVAALGSSANYVTKHLSGVVRSIAEVLRTLGVWMTGLFVFYIVGWRDSSSPGEAWTARSWIEFLGFVFMVVGTLVFRKVLVVPLPFLYASEKDKVTKAASPSTKAESV